VTFRFSLAAAGAAIGSYLAHVAAAAFSSAVLSRHAHGSLRGGCFILRHPHVSLFAVFGHVALLHVATGTAAFTYIVG
tara:strand:+ start:121053 stop:121286 length:234 start_codon:yes stop_codon:yes gene_type:complete